MAKHPTSVIPILILAACVENVPSGALSNSAEPAISAAWDSSSDVIPDRPECVNDCYVVTVGNTFMTQLNPTTGQGWDADGSLPDPYATVALNGKVIGQTTTWLDSELIYYSSMDSYAAKWNETIGVAEFHAGDRLDVQVYDDSGYLVNKCGFKLSPLFLANGAVACEQGPPDVGQIYITFKKTRVLCGNGVRDVGEECDSGGIDTATCNGKLCTIARCDDGYLNLAADSACTRP